MTSKQKQLQLKHLGYYTGAIDGLLGPKFKSATLKFQQVYKLSVDGSFGPKTEAKTIEVWKDIQTKLRAKGFDCGAIDGYVGNNTINALRNFQKANGLIPDASCGPLTLAKLNETVKPLSWDDFKNFKREEFKCPCGKCNGYPSEPSLKLVEVLQGIRDHFNSPLNITSGVRCQTYNDSLKGSVKNSPHIKGLAADFYIVGVDKSKVLAYCQELKKQGKIAYTYTNNTNMGRAVHINL